MSPAKSSSPAGPLLVYDVGGTSLRTGVWSVSSDELLRRGVRESPSFHAHPGLGLDQLVARLLEGLREEAGALLGAQQPSAVGVAMPGPVDAEGRVHGAPPLWGDAVGAPVPLAELCRAIWPDRPVAVVNDVTAAGYRYAPESGVFCAVTVSSGIGHKVFVDGHVVVGRDARGGEIGHWRVDAAPDAPRCDCGERGHLGALASGRALPFHVERLAHRLAAEHEASPVSSGSSESLDRSVAEAFRAADPFAVEVVREMAAPLGSALAALHLGVGVEQFVVLGGWARALGSGYLELLAQSAEASCWKAGAAWQRMIVAGEADDDSGLVGMGRWLRRSSQTL